MLSAQGRGSLQVAAQVLSLEPSRTALGAAIQALDHPDGPGVIFSSLARIRVEPVAGRAPGDAKRPRAVRIDFLRN